MPEDPISSSVDLYAEKTTENIKLTDLLALFDVDETTSAGFNRRVTFGSLKTWILSLNAAHKLDATAAPEVTDDVDEGWSVGNLWVDVSADPRRVWICLNPAANAAVWLELGVGSDGSASLLVGIAAPDDAADGADGDLFIDSLAWNIYGPKAAGAWGGATSLVGPAGDDGEDGVGVPAGGGAGQVLAKASAADFDTEWVDGEASGSNTSELHAEVFGFDEDIVNGERHARFVPYGFQIAEVKLYVVTPAGDDVELMLKVNGTDLFTADQTIPFDDPVVTVPLASINTTAFPNGVIPEDARLDCEVVSGGTVSGGSVSSGGAEGLQVVLVGNVSEV